MMLKTKARLVGIALLIVLGVCLGGSPAFAAFPPGVNPGDTGVFYVSVDGAQPAAVPVSQRFTSVSAAVAANELDSVGGRTILVDEGVYTESFFINFPVTLKGVNQNAIIQTIPGVAAGDAVGIGIASSNVIISDLTIKGYEATTSGQSVITLVGGSGVLDTIKIVNNRIEPGYYANASQSSGTGILSNTSSTPQFTNVLIDGNVIEPASGALNPSGTAARPIYLNPGAEAIVSGNTIIGNYVAGCGFSGQQGKVEVKNNTFSGISAYSLVISTGGRSGSEYSNWTEVKVLNNSFSGATGYYIYVYQCAIFHIYGNTFSAVTPTSALVAIRQTFTEGVTIPALDTLVTGTPNVYSGALLGNGYIEYRPKVQSTPNLPETKVDPKVEQKTEPKKEPEPIKVLVLPKVGDQTAVLPLLMMLSVAGMSLVPTISRARKNRK